MLWLLSCGSQRPRGSFYTRPWRKSLRRWAMAQKRHSTAPSSGSLIVLRRDSVAGVTPHRPSPPKRAAGTADRIMGIRVPKTRFSAFASWQSNAIADIRQVEPIPPAYWIGRQTAGACNFDNSGILGRVRSIAIGHCGWFPRPHVWTFLIPRRGCINQPRVVRQRTTLGRGVIRSIPEGDE